MGDDAVNTPRRATIWEVAKTAGVSHQTVSRYLRRDPQMRPETVARVSRAVEELDYRPDLTARSMRTRRSGRIAVFLPTVTRAHAIQILTGVLEVAHEEGYAVEVVSVEGPPDVQLERTLEIADSGRVEAVLSLSSLPPESLRRLPPGAAVVSSVDFDDKLRGVGPLADGSPVAELVAHLAQLGHERILHVTGSLDFASARGRRDVFVETIEGLGLGPALIHEGDWSPESGREAVLAMPETGRPTAVVAPNDFVAAAAIQAAHERGWRLPSELSVTGWDNEVVSKYLVPALTTVDVDRRQLGRRAMARLFATMRSEQPPETTGPLNTILWRDSTAPPGGRATSGRPHGDRALLK